MPDLISEMAKNNLFKRLVCNAIVFIVLGCAISNTLSAQQGTVIKTLVIDAGHGGKDPGAIGPGGKYEAHLALAIALKFGALIEKHFPKIKTVYTRKTDVFLTLNERADIANKAKADLFFCVHLNSSTNKLAFGSSTYALGLHRTEENLEAAKRENAVIELEEGGLKNYEFDPNSPEGHIIMSMKQNAFLEQSLQIASYIEDEQGIVANRKSRGVKQAGFYVLYKTSMPSILTEIGFISNPEEEAFMASERGQKLVALSLFKGFLKYKNAIEGKNEKFDFSYMLTEEDKGEQNKPISEKKDTLIMKQVQKDTIAKKTPEKQPVKDTVKVKNEARKTTLDTAKIRVETQKQITKIETVAQIPEKQKVPERKEVKPISESSVISSDLVIRVQLLAGNAYPKNRKEIEEKFGEIYTEKLPNGITRFMVGNFKTVKEARAIQPKVQAMGFADAFITAYENMQRISNKRLAELLKL